MKYKAQYKNFIDVTQAPYWADNTGKSDCTQVLRNVFDDLLRREISGIQETKDKLLRSEIPTYIGFESRITKGYLGVIFPEYVPASRIIYFPAGTYLVSDTVGYTLDNLQNIYHGKPFSELCRGIHIVGEGEESVTIRLADHSPGYEIGEKKPVLSFLKRECMDKSGEITNVAQMNTIRDVTIDCGIGNPGAIGLCYIANNSGCIRSVNIKAGEGYCGLRLAYGSEGTISELSVEGFMYGVEMHHTSVCVFEGCELSKNYRSAFLTGNSLVVLRNIHSFPLPLMEFDDSGQIDQGGCYYCAQCDSEPLEETYGNYVHMDNGCEYYDSLSIPKADRSERKDDWVCVDDFGAVGDCITDCTQAIQNALNSGKPVILFGEGHYLINGEVKIPATVKTIDFMFCDLIAGEALVNTRNGSFLAVDEDCDDELYIENLYAFEQFHGHFHLVKHAAKRDVVLSDLHTQAAAMYINTVSGSRVYLDNCACTTGTYSRDCIISREGYLPEFCYLVPFEFHGQQVYGRQVNPERADVEILNDASEVFLDGLKVEGPGTAVCTVNGGRTVINVFSAGIGMPQAENALFETIDSKLYFVLGKVFGFDLASCYNFVFRVLEKGLITQKHFDDFPSSGAYCKKIKEYRKN